MFLLKEEFRLIRHENRLVARLAVCLVALNAGMSGEAKIPTRHEPRANQVLYVTTTQALRLGQEAETGASPSGTPVLVTQSELRYIQKNGRFDERGRMRVQLEIVDFEWKNSVNGTPKPPGSIGPLNGRTLTAVLDRGGRLVDLEIPEDLKQPSAVLKQLVAGAFGVVNLLPADSLSVGETITMPTSIPLRLRGGAEPLQHQLLASITLRALDKQGDQRVARLEQRIEPPARNDAMKVNGVGTIDLNLDRGFIAASSMEWTFVGEGMPGGAAKSPAGGVRATMLVSVTAHE